MENDDRQMGRILNRREALKLLGLAGAALLASCAPGQTSTEQPTSAPTPDANRWIDDSSYKCSRAGNLRSQYRYLAGLRCATRDDRGALLCGRRSQSV